MAVRGDVVVVGGGIVGVATARALAARAPGLGVVVVEAEDRLAAHQTGHNSGVIHSGLYYKPGSLKARYCTEGREALYRFCAEHGVAHDPCGKIVVAAKPEQLPQLREVMRRGTANGLRGLRELSIEELREVEPHVAGVAGCRVRETGIVNYTQVTEKLGELVRAAGGRVLRGARATGFRRDGPEVVLETAKGEVRAQFLVNCGGLQSDRLARLCGVEPGVTITPFRGEYYELVPSATRLVRHLIYPVPDPRFPFLGVHFTRMIGGGVEAGPNAVLALKREGYRHRDVSLRDVAEMVGQRAFWTMAGRYWRTGAGEFYRSLSKAAFLRALRELVPALRWEHIHRAGAGVRAQALAPDGSLVDDFRIVTAGRMVHVLNAPSPAATACLRIGAAVADMVAAHADAPDALRKAPAKAA